MNTSNAIAGYPSAPATAANSQNAATANPSAADKPASSPPAVGNNPSTAVSVSGKALMFSRLFRDIPNPRFMSGSEGSSINNINVPGVLFLTERDRALLADIYAYAQQQGADLRYVDMLAGHLGDYRKLNDGKFLMSFNDGNSYDLEGHRLSIRFSEKNAATAARTLNSEAFNSTRLDKGFIRFKLDPGTGALAVGMNLDFLEQIINKFSDKGEGVTLDPKFRQFDIENREDRYVISKSKEILAPTFVADYESINGVGRWRTPELAAAAANEGKKKSSASDLNLRILDALVNKKPADFSNAASHPGKKSVSSHLGKPVSAIGQYLKKWFEVRTRGELQV